MSQPSLEVTHKHVAEFNQPGGDPGLVHYLPGQYEKRHGHQGKHVHACKIALGHQLQNGTQTHLQHGEKARDAQDKTHWHAYQNKH
ncbi:MAG: hypothetical protein XD80_1489 [Synergistales bacterium 53_16]|nr:MAG: hypothetical protein XD80_1489 [Synergistales bacterium 53_16]